VYEQKINSLNSWKEYWLKNKKPNNIPKNPDTIYKNDGWVSWDDFFNKLGNGKHDWKKHNLIYFIKSLETELVNLDSVELITIINSNNLAKKIAN